MSLDIDTYRCCHFFFNYDINSVPFCSTFVSNAKLSSIVIFQASFRFCLWCPCLGFLYLLRVHCKEGSETPVGGEKRGYGKRGPQPEVLEEIIRKTKLGVEYCTQISTCVYVLLVRVTRVRTQIEAPSPRSILRARSRPLSRIKIGDWR